MDKSIYQIAQEAIKNKYHVSEPPEREVSKQNKSNPHLAICSDSNPSANNRHNSLMLKAKDTGLVSLVKSEDVATEFEEFCKTLTDPSVLLDLYMFCKQSGEVNFIQELIDYNKE